MKVFVIPVTSYQQNCSLLICEATHKAALVDPGGEVEKLVQAIAQHHSMLESIILTHGHLDHIGATAELAHRFSVPILGPHQDDRFLIDAIVDQCHFFGFPVCDTFEPTRWLNDGDTVTVGDECLEVIHCPGHTPGHIVLFHRQDKLALVGDVLFKGSIGRTDLARGNFNSLIHSIKNRLWPLGQDVTFIPGHGPSSSFGFEMRHNPFLNS